MSLYFRELVLLLGGAGLAWGYLNRRDLTQQKFMVKARGNRIELGEIESVLGQHPYV